MGRLYGLNTIGAAVGSLLCGFWLIDLLGVWGTLLLAVVLNGAIGAACILVSSRLPQTRGGLRENRESPSKSRPRFVSPKPISSLGSYALVIFAVSGFCAMAYEVIWIKLLGLIVGPTTYSFTIVLVTFITGLALGAMFFGWLGDRIKNTMILLLVTQIAAALFALMFSQIAGNSQIFFAKLIYQFKDNFAYLYLVKAVVLFVFMFPPTFCLGATFPLVGKIYTTSLSRTGRSIGFAYAVNSVGAVLGSFCAGFLSDTVRGQREWSETRDRDAASDRSVRRASSIPARPRCLFCDGRLWCSSLASAWVSCFIIRTGTARCSPRASIIVLTHLR